VGFILAGIARSPKGFRSNRNVALAYGPGNADLSIYIKGQKLLPKNLPKDTDPAQIRILD
jgi:hypothetical protein